MREMKTVTVPEKTITSVAKYVCDLCGAKTSDDHNWLGQAHPQHRYGVAETIVELRKGFSFPEDGEVKTTSFDICTVCFEEKLVPWFEAQGATPRKDEY